MYVAILDLLDSCSRSKRSQRTAPTPVIVDIFNNEFVYDNAQSWHFDELVIVETERCDFDGVYESRTVSVREAKCVCESLDSSLRGSGEKLKIVHMLLTIICTHAVDGR